MSRNKNHFWQRHLYWERMKEVYGFDIRDIWALVWAEDNKCCPDWRERFSITLETYMLMEPAWIEELYRQGVDIRQHRLAYAEKYFYPYGLMRKGQEYDDFDVYMMRTNNGYVDRLRHIARNTTYGKD
jgi:hypothetical protein